MEKHILNIIFHILELQGGSPLEAASDSVNTFSKTLSFSAISCSIIIACFVFP